MRRLDMQGWNCRKDLMWKYYSGIFMIFLAGVWLSGCSGRYDMWGRPTIIDASKRQTSEETLVATRSGVQSSRQTASREPYHATRSENPRAYSQQAPYRATGNQRQAYQNDEYDPRYSGPSVQQRGGYNSAAGNYNYENRRQGNFGGADPSSGSHSYTEDQRQAMSGGTPPMNTNRTSVGQQQYENYGRRQSPSMQNYPPNQTGNNYVSPNGIGSHPSQTRTQNPQRLPSQNPPPPYGRSADGMPKVSSLSVTEVYPPDGSQQNNYGMQPNPISPAPTAIATGVEPGIQNNGFTSNTTHPAPSVPVPYPPNTQRGQIDPAVSVSTPGHFLPRGSVANAIAELEKYRNTNEQDLHATLALYCLYLTQQPEKARKNLPMNVEEANQTLELLDVMRKKVAPRADFSISCMKVCDKVISFGNYQETSSKQLENGEARKVYVYCELENFDHKLDTEGRYLSDIFITIRLYDSQLNLKKQKAVLVPDTPSYSRRRDFFLVGDLDIPELAPGTYEMRVQAEDKIAGKLAKPMVRSFEVRSADNFRRSFN
jgi:hypothetical protein